jgi:hypothetical protein
MSRKKILILLLTLLVLTLPVFPNAKLAQTGFKYFKRSSDARGAALCDALTTLRWGPVPYLLIRGDGKNGHQFDIAVSKTSGSRILIIIPIVWRSALTAVGMVSLGCLSCRLIRRIDRNNGF